MAILQVEDIQKRFGRTRVLEDISFSLEKGQALSIIGSSGSGKSTLLHIIAGVDIPTSGTVFLNGQDVYAQNRQQLAIFRRR